MTMHYCHNCHSMMGHKRLSGIGTLLLTVLTGGLWLFTIPDYLKRCIRCGNALPKYSKRTQKVVNIVSLIALAIGLYYYIAIQMQISDYYASHSNTHYTGAGTDHPGISYEDQYQICTTMNGYESCYTKPRYTK